jgi:hypothetical protein
MLREDKNVAMRAGSTTLDGGKSIHAQSYLIDYPKSTLLAYIDNQEVIIDIIEAGTGFTANAEIAARCKKWGPPWAVHRTDSKIADEKLKTIAKTVNELQSYNLTKCTRNCK